MNTYGRFRTIGLASILVLSAVNRVCADDSGYSFSVNGEPAHPVHYSLNADDSILVAGDVIYVGEKKFNYGGLFMTLGEEKDCRFVTEPAEIGNTKTSDEVSRMSLPDGRVFVELPDGRRKVIGATVTRTFLRHVFDPNEHVQDTDQGARKRLSSNMVTVNPLDRMSAEEIYGLWGIYLNNWPKGIEQKLAHVNTDRVCITVSDYAGVAREGSSYGHVLFPPLPPQIRYLVVEESMSPGMRDFSHFSWFHDLVFLKFKSFPREPLDADLICQNVGLRYLDVSGCGIPNFQKLASLTEMRFLNISRCREIDNLEFVKNMHQLRTLFIGLTKISSLSPLNNSDSIREIHAGMTEVHDLPKGTLRSLRMMNLVSSKVAARSVEQFRKDHPACIVHCGWADTLRNAVQGTTRLRVRSGGTCHRQIDQEKTLAEIKETNEIEHFLNGIVIDESQSGFHCMCCGNPTLEFYEGDRLLAMIGYHHAQSLRWAGGQWSGDGLLTESGRDFVVSWLSQKGVDGPRREREEQQRQQDEEARRQRRYREIIPAQTFRAVVEAQTTREISWADDTLGEKRQKLVAEAFKKNENDAQTSIAIYLRVLGVTANDPWTVFYYYENIIVKHVLPRFRGPELARAAIDAMADDEGTMGAARWFLAENGWRDLDEADRERILPALARRAIEHRHVSIRKRTMNALCEINTTWAADLLCDMLSWPIDPNWTTPKAKYGLKIDLPNSDQIYANECSDSVWAAFCLMKMSRVESLAAIQKLADEYQGRDKELLQRALQLLREKDTEVQAKRK